MSWLPCASAKQLYEAVKHEPQCADEMGDAHAPNEANTFFWNFILVAILSGA